MNNNKSNNPNTNRSTLLFINNSDNTGNTGNVVTLTPYNHNDMSLSKNSSALGLDITVSKITFGVQGNQGEQVDTIGESYNPENNNLYFTPN